MDNTRLVQLYDDLDEGYYSEEVDLYQMFGIFYV